MSKFYGAGLAVGILVGIIIVVFVMKFWNNDGKMKTRYDEMQEKARGTAYMYAFWAVVICEAVLMVLDVMELELPMDRTVMHMIPILFGAVVQAGYSIWHDAYIGLNNNRKRLGIAFILIAALNFLVGIMALAEGNLLVDGKLTFQTANWIVGLLFVFIGLEMVVKHLVDRNKGEE